VDSSNGGRASRGFALLVIAFCIGAGAVIATRLDESAISAVLGAVCALAFGVPATMIGTVILMRYRQTQQSRETETRTQPQQPPVVVIQPGQYPQLGQPMQQYPPWYNSDLDRMPIPRDFTVIGDDD